MEIHSHTHTQRKKWTNYLWEFLMLFLAVFCGFLAENIREHGVEHQREKQYMQSLVSDLANDTILLNAGFPRKEERVTAIDSTFLFFETNHDPSSIPGYVVRNIRRTLWDRTYRRNTVTIDQLKNAGGMRLIRKKAVADSISAYDLHWERLEFYREAYFTMQQAGSSLIEKIFNAYDLLQGYRKSSSGNTTGEISDTQTVSINTAYLNEFLNFIHSQKTFTIQDEQNYKSLRDQALRLMELIKKEYRLE